MFNLILKHNVIYSISTDSSWQPFLYYLQIIAIISLFQEEFIVFFFFVRIHSSKSEIPFNNKIGNSPRFCALISRKKFSFVFRPFQLLVSRHFFFVRPFHYRHLSILLFSSFFRPSSFFWLKLHSAQWMADRPLPALCHIDLEWCMQSSVNFSVFYYLITLAEEQLSVLSICWLLCSFEAVIFTRFFPVPQRCHKLYKQIGCVCKMQV